MMTWNEALLQRIERFLDETKMGPAYFGKKAAGSTEIVSQLRNGRTVRLDTAERILKFIRSERLARRRSG